MHIGIHRVVQSNSDIVSNERVFREVDLVMAQVGNGEEVMGHVKSLNCSVSSEIPTISAEELLRAEPIFHVVILNLIGT